MNVLGSITRHCQTYNINRLKMGDCKDREPSSGQWPIWRITHVFPKVTFRLPYSKNHIGFREAWIGNIIVTGLQSGYRANKLHICKLMFYFFVFFQPGTRCNVCFVINICRSYSPADSIDSKTLYWQKAIWTRSI